MKRCIGLILTLLFLCFGAEAGAQGNILIYSTYFGSGGQYPYDYFNDELPLILGNFGYIVDVTDRNITPEITSALISSYDEFWLLSANEAGGENLIQAEIDALIEFHESGRGILIMADHAPDYTGDANQIAGHFGVNFYGWENHGSDVEITPDYIDHPISADVTTILGHESESNMTVDSPAMVIGTYQEDNIIAIFDQGLGRVVFEVSFTRAFDEHAYKFDMPQYFHNIADWLYNGEPQNIPTLSEWGMLIMGLLLLAFGSVAIVRRRKQAII